jgi:hypothetical protein
MPEEQLIERLAKSDDTIEELRECKRRLAPRLDMQLRRLMEHH